MTLFRPTQSEAATPDPALSTNEAIDLILSKLVGWLEAAVQMLPNLILAAVIVGAFWFLSGLTRRGANRLLGRAVDNQQVVRLLSRVLSLLVLAAGLFVALGILGLDKTVTTFLAGAGVIGLALGFAFQDTAENFISGVLLATRRPFRTGDLVEANGVLGVVESTNLRATTIRRLDGPVVLVPNSDVYKNPLTNFIGGNGRRVEVAVGVSYDDDLARAEKIALEAVEDLPGRDTRRDPECLWNEFGGSSINCAVRIWLEAEDQASFLAAQSEAIKRIKSAFDSQGVSIPYPIRTLDFSMGELSMRNASAESVGAD